MNKQRNGIALVAILLVAVVLRPPVAQMGPILELIQKSLNLTATEIALLASTPVLCFGFGAFLTPSLVRRIGLDKTLIAVMGLLLLSILARPYLGFIG
ncbi:MAG: hypothetical protein ACKOOE_08745, partial [Micrococcales bacterium]